MLVSANVLPQAQAMDIMTLANAEKGYGFNPLLADKCKRTIKRYSLVWMQLCVFEDKIARMLDLATKGHQSHGKLLRELSTKRIWSVEKHHLWLIFEVEQQLQIREEQYVTALTMLLNTPCVDFSETASEDDNPFGAVVQLNMGEGKTRVILPMLLLELTLSRQKLIRLTFLPTLLDDAHHALHQSLTASVINKKLFTMPFHRGAFGNRSQLTGDLVNRADQGMQIVSKVLEHCRDEGGALLLAQQHLMSLRLKSFEFNLDAAHE
jgi:hypothetical protein